LIGYGTMTRRRRVAALAALAVVAVGVLGFGVWRHTESGPQPSAAEKRVTMIMVNRTGNSGIPFVAIANNERAIRNGASFDSLTRQLPWPLPRPTLPAGTNCGGTVLVIELGRGRDVVYWSCTEPSWAARISAEMSRPGSPWRLGA
jgi:hypothetical protein